VNVARRVRLLVAGDGTPTVELAAMPSRLERPTSVVVDDRPVDPAEVWLYHKTTRRSTYEARAARHPYADDVILVNDRNEATETTVANLAVRLEGRWWTPPLEAGCLPGVERGRLVETGRLAERAVALDELYAAEAVALVSSLRGWRLATLVPARGNGPQLLAEELAADPPRPLPNPPARPMDLTPAAVAATDDAVIEPSTGVVP
jgi:para-aminobenzoate synthetase/4-amino-4-deoxychorismate lyase